MGITIEISSYPKSGNTMMRAIVASYLSFAGFKGDLLPPDIHRSKNLEKNMSQFKIGKNYYSFYKSHKTFNNKINPDLVIYIYRHPLDVLLSTLNFNFLQNDSKIFIDT